MNNTPTPRSKIILDHIKIYVEADNAAQSYAHYKEVNKEIESMERELTAVTEQRDGLHELHNKNAARSKELLELCGTLRKQRDRLVEAFEHTMKHMRHSLNCPARISEGLHACNCQMEWAYDNATEALQSLNPYHTVDANDMIAAVKGGADEPQG